MIIEVETINSFSKSELLKEVYGLIWILPILTLLLGITIEVLLIVWLESQLAVQLRVQIFFRLRLSLPNSFYFF